MEAHFFVSSYWKEWGRQSKRNYIVKHKDGGMCSGCQAERRQQHRQRPWGVCDKDWFTHGMSAGGSRDVSMFIPAGLPQSQNTTVEFKGFPTQ